MSSLTGDSHIPRSFGDFLCLADALAIIGGRLDDAWRERDLAALNNSGSDPDAHSRAQIGRKRLRDFLIGGYVRAFGLDDEGANFEIDRQRLSKPYFEIDVERSCFRWAPNQWDVIFVSKSDLEDRLDAIRPSTARKTIKLDWRDVCNITWKLALDDIELRKPNRLITAVQDAFMMKHNQQPDAKELRPLVNEIIEHLGDRTLSRDVSGAKSSCDPPSESV